MEIQTRMPTPVPGRANAWLLIVLFVVGLGSLSRSLVAEETFREPKVDGARVDWCLAWGNDCGQPAADEFCRRQGFKRALSFEVTKGVGPTLILGSGQTCPSGDGFFYVTCTQEDQAPPGQGRGQGARSGGGEGWRYQILAQGKVIEAASTPSRTGPLLDFKPIDVAGFKTARVFLRVMELSPEREEKLTKDAKLRVEGFHSVRGVTHPYFEAEIPMKVATEMSGWVEIPVIGRDLRIVVWGDNLPNFKLQADCTVYLLE